METLPRWQPQGTFFIASKLLYIYQFIQIILETDAFTYCVCSSVCLSEIHRNEIQKLANLSGPVECDKPLCTKQFKITWSNMTNRTGCGYYALQVLLQVPLNYRVEERIESPTLFTYSQTTFIRKKKTKNIKILVKNTLEHLKEQAGTIISITSEDECKIFYWPPHWGRDR